MQPDTSPNGASPDDPRPGGTSPGGLEPGASKIFPAQAVALKVLGDAVLTVTLLQAGSLPPDRALNAVALGLLIGVIASTAAGIMLQRAGWTQLWEVVSIACMGAMVVLLLLHGALVVAGMVAAFAWWRWRNLVAAAA